MARRKDGDVLGVVGVDTPRNAVILVVGPAVLALEAGADFARKSAVGLRQKQDKLPLSSDASTITDLELGDLGSNLGDRASDLVSQDERQNRFSPACTSN